MGWNTKMIVTGDLTQIDLPHKTSGLVKRFKILDGVEGISVIKMTKKDIVRHKLVTRIVDAYDRYEQINKPKRTDIKQDNYEQSIDKD